MSAIAELTLKKKTGRGRKSEKKRGRKLYV